MIVAGMLSVGFLALGGCANGPVPVTYSPASTLSATGDVTVGTFNYDPAEKGTTNKNGNLIKVQPNQIRNTAIGSIMIAEPVGQYVQEAVFKELRFVGVKLDNKNLVLTGEIQDFLADDLGYSVDWTLVTHYVVKDQGGKTVYDGPKTTKQKTAKFINFNEALNTTIQKNIADLIQDPDFIKAIN
ncbi:MAG TPA: hypothetical protein VGM16_02645 [Gammaproteobacteria bacterium]